MLRIEIVDATSECFTSGFKRLPSEIKAEAAQALSDLLRTPHLGRLRIEKLSGYKKPGIYTIHITRNHSHKASFEINGTTAIMRKVGTHKEIDRAP